MTHPAIRILASDLDGTLLADDPGSARRFAAFWEALPARARPRLCYSSGRLGPDVRAGLPGSGLPPADFIVGGVGTSLTDGLGNVVEGFTQRFHEGWDRALVQETVNGFPGVTPQPLQYQSPFKASWYWLGADPDRLAELGQRLAALELRALVVYSSGRDLDVLPQLGGKGNALRWLCEHLGFTVGDAVVAGDSENDLAMFALPQVRGIVVANATPGLQAQAQGPGIHRTRAPAGDGVIEGLRFFGLDAPHAARRPPRGRTT